MSELETALAAKDDVWLTNALQIANNPVIVEAMSNGDRVKCIDILDQYSSIFKENTGFRNVQVHLIDSSGRSFVKSWAPDSFGEDVSYSEAYKEVLRNGTAMVTPEVSSKGMRLKGLFPVMSDDRIIGIANFEGGLNSIKRSLKPKNIDFIYFLNDEYLSIATSLQGSPSVQGYTLSQSDTDEKFFTYVQEELEWKKAEEGYSFDSSYLTVAKKIERFDGAVMGMYLIAQDSNLVTLRVEESIQLLLTLYLAFLVLLVLLLIILLIFLNRSIIKPIRLFSRNLVEMSKGALDIAFTGQKRKDEIGQLSRAMSSMQSALQEKASVIRSFSKGDFSASFTKVAEEDELGESILTMKDSINNLIGRINVTVDKVSEGSSQVSTASQSLSRQSMEQASSLEEITSSTVEINSQSKKNAENANNAFSIAKTATSEAENGKQHMDNLAGIMVRINNSSDEISKVVKVIDDIAFQINLLALNANVEAARAGKYGKGFAVVAEEVRNLAVRSADSVKETTRMVQETVDNIEAGNRATGETAQQLKSIVDNSGKVAVILEEIAHSSNEQVLAIGQISNGLEQIDRATQASTANAEESASAAEILAGQAQRLRDMVSQFTLDETLSERPLQDH